MQSNEISNKQDWLTYPTPTQDHLLNELETREWVDYLLMNGWKLRHIAPNQWNTTLGRHEKVSLVKEVTTISPATYFLDYQKTELHTTKLTCLVDANGQVSLKNQIICDGFEKDLGAFAIICNAMDWVSLKKANSMCKAETGSSLTQYLIEAKEKQVNSLFNAMASFTKPIPIDRQTPAYL